MLNCVSFKVISLSCGMNLHVAVKPQSFTLLLSLASPDNPFYAIKTIDFSLHFLAQFSSMKTIREQQVFLLWKENSLSTFSCDLHAHNQSFICFEKCRDLKTSPKSPSTLHARNRPALSHRMSFELFYGHLISFECV